METIFAHTRYQYDSYTDYRRLVELAGFKTCFVDEINFQQQETLYIVSPLNGEYQPHWENHRKKTRRARVAHWALERPSVLSEFITGLKKQLDGGLFDYIFLSDKWLTEQLYDSRVKFVILGSHERLGAPAPVPKQWDIVHMSYEVDRRRQILNKLRERNLKIAENGWGDLRHERLQASRILLNVHQDDWPVLEPLRFSLAAAYALPVITERIHDAYPYTRQGEGHYIIQSDYYSLVSTVLATVASEYEPLRAMGTRLRDAMVTEFEFGRQVRQAVAALDGQEDLVIR